MLLVRMIREREGSDENSSYEVRVYINDRRIWMGRVTNHHRMDGWAILLIKLARAAFLGPNYNPPEVRTTHCPACGHGLRKKKA